MSARNICLDNTSRTLYLCVLLLLPVTNGSSAEDTDVLSLAPEKVQNLMQRSKLLEGEIRVRQKNAEQRNDPSSKQYSIGFSDGYNKAVLDLLRSQLLNGVPKAGTRPRTTPAPPPIQDIQETQDNVTTSANNNDAGPGGVQQGKTVPRGISITAPVPVPGTISVPRGAQPRQTMNPAKSQAMPHAPAVAVTSQPATKDVTTTVKSAPADAGNNYADLLLQSTNSLEAKNWSQAISFASAALTLQPKSGEALINRSWAYAEQGLLHKALVDANAAARIRPDNALVYNNRGYIYELLEDLPRARQDYQRACELDFHNACGIVAKIDELTENRPEKIATLMAQSQDKIRRKSWRGLEALSDQIIKLDPMHTEALVNRSWAYAEQGQLDKALRDANRAIKISPNNALAYNNRAYTYELRNKLDKATLDYKKACDLNYQPACVVVKKIDQLQAKKPKQVKKSKKSKKSRNIAKLIDKSLEMFRKKNWHAVEQLSNKVLSLDPRNALAYVNRAGARAEMGLMYNALDDIDAALKLNPKLGIAYNNRAYTLERMGKLSSAAKEYKRACDLGVQQSCQDFRRINPAPSSRR